MSVQAVRTTSVVVLSCDAPLCEAKHHGPSSPQRADAMRRAATTARTRGWVVTTGPRGDGDPLHYCAGHGHLAPSAATR